MMTPIVPLNCDFLYYDSIIYHLHDMTSKHPPHVLPRYLDDKKNFHYSGFFHYSVEKYNVIGLYVPGTYRTRTVLVPYSS